MKTYVYRVRELEREGLTTSDAQAVADVEVARGQIEPDTQGAIKYPMAPLKRKDRLTPQ
jgi:hypothetical protein